MTAKYLALIVAAVALAACETATPPEASAPSASIMTSPVQKRVVRGPIVPDDEPIIASAPRAAPAASRVPKSPAATAAVQTATTASEAAAGAVTGSTTTEATPPVGETSSSVSVTDLAPPVTSAQPTANEAPTKPWLPELSIGTLKDMMNANVGGFPLWLMVLIGIVLAGALVFGMGGRREGETYAEPA